MSESPCSVTSASTSPAQPPGDRALLDNCDSVGLRERAEDRLGVERAERPQVDHLGRDALLGKRIGRGQAVVNALHHAHERDVAPSRTTAAFPSGTSSPAAGAGPLFE